MYFRKAAKLPVANEERVSYTEGRRKKKETG